MIDGPAQDDRTFSLAAQRLIDRRRLAFENAWKAGRTPAIELYLEAVPEPERSHLLHELLLIDVAYRRQSGQTPTAEEYEARFPGSGPVIASGFQQPTLDLASHPSMPRTKTEIFTAQQAIAAEPGAKLGRFGDYELLEKIARGGMGVVFRARQISLGRIVALKMILAGRLASEEEIQRFYAEAQAAAQLDHPGIVPIYEVGQHEGQHYFTMGYVEGQSLASKLAEGPLAPRRAAQLVQATAEAVHYAHQHGVIHRDLKPANILLDCQGRPRVTDFGLAKRAAANTGLTATGEVVGTPSYMPPEQAAGHLDQIGPASDVYSLGAVLYSLVIGRPPFQAASAVDTLMQVLSLDPLPPRQLNGDVPRDLETITLKCLERQSQRRYPTAQALEQELARFLAGEPIQARPVSKIERAWRWCRRNPTIAAAAGLAAIALVATMVVSIAFAVYHANAAARLREEQQQTQLALDEAQSQRDRATKTLVDLHTTSGLTADARGEPSVAVLWFANAARLAAGDPQREHDNRVRVRTWLRRCYIPVHAFRHAGAALRAMAIHPDGRRLATIGIAGDCTIWDIEREKPLVLPGAPAQPSAAAWSPDGKRLAMGSRDGKVFLLRFPEGNCLRRIAYHGRIAAVVFSRHGRYLAVAGDGARVWDVQTQSFATPEFAHPQGVVAAAFNSAGNRLATACRDGRARVFAVGAGGSRAEPLFAPVPHALWDEADASNPRPVAPIFVNQDRELLTITRGSGGGIVWRDAANGNVLYTSQEPDVQTMNVSPDGRYVVIGAYKKARLWDVGRRIPVGSLMDHDNDVLWAEFRQDGRVLATAGADNVARCWSVPEGRPLGPAIPHQTFVHLAGFLPGSGLVVTAQAGGLVRAWRPPCEDPHNWQIPLGRDTVSRIALSPDGKYVIPSSVSCRTGRLHSTRVYEAATGRPAGPPLEPTSAITDAALLPDGRHAALLVSGKADPPGGIEIWDWRAGSRVGRPIPTPSEPRSLACRPEAPQLAVLCAQGELLLVDAAQTKISRRLSYGRCLYGREPDEYTCNGTVRFSPDGQSLLAWGLDNAVHAWDVAAGRPRYAPWEHEGKCHDVQFSRDGRLAVTASYDHTARVWDLRTGQPLAKSIPHPDRVLTASFSPDGQYVLTARRNGSWRIYDWQAGSLLCPAFPLSGENFAATFTPDGHWIATTDGDTMRLWEWHTGKWVTPPAELGGLGLALAITPDSRYAIVAGLGGTVNAFHLGDLAPRERLSMDDLCLLAEIVAAQRIHADHGVVRLSASEWLKRWQRFSNTGAGTFRVR